MSDRMTALNTRWHRIWAIAQYDFKKRYHKKRLGLIWALFNPLIRIGIYFTVFTAVFKIEEENYGLFLFSGILIWNLFAESTNRGIKILSARADLIDSIQFKSLDLFISHVVSIFLGFSFNLFVFVLFCFFSNVDIGFSILLFPLVLLTIFVISLGTTLMLSVINIYFTDIEHFWTLFLLFGFWTSGVFQRTELYVESFPQMMYFNPFLGIIMNSRNCLMYDAPLDWGVFLYDLVYSFVILLIGLWFFNRFGDKVIEKL